MDFFGVKLQDMGLSLFHGVGKAAHRGRPEQEKTSQGVSTPSKGKSCYSAEAVADADIIDVPSVACLVDEETGERIGQNTFAEKGFRIYSKDRRVFYEFGQESSTSDVAEQLSAQMKPSVVLRSRGEAAAVPNWMAEQAASAPHEKPTQEQAARELLHRARSVAAAPGWEVQLDLFDPSSVAVFREFSEKSPVAMSNSGTEPAVADKTMTFLGAQETADSGEQGLLDVDEAGRWILPMVPTDAGKGVVDEGDGVQPTPAAALVAEAEAEEVATDDSSANKAPTALPRRRWLDFAPFEAVQNFISQFYVQELRPRLQYVYNFLA